MKRFQEARKTIFIGIAQFLREREFEVNIRPISPDCYYSAGLQTDYAILDKMLVPQENVLTLRRAYIQPWWTLERAEYQENFRMSRRRFNKSKIDRETAKKFAENWRKRKINHTLPPPRGEIILAAFQGHLLRKRQGQSMKPIEMLDVLRANEPDRHIVAKLHPGGEYTTEELEVFEKRCVEQDIEISTSDIELLMPDCFYVATMNSSVGFQSMLWGRPSLLFGKADYHHANVSFADFTNPHDAFQAIHEHTGDFDQYLQWYLRNNMINGFTDPGLERAKTLIKNFGWPV